jgi:hypothetical protein
MAVLANVDPAATDIPPRWYRRGHYADALDFATEDMYRAMESPLGALAALAVAFAALKAWARTLVACTAPAPHEWGVPSDAPVPVQPLERLTPIRPHAPDGLCFEEVAAA